MATKTVPVYALIEFNGRAIVMDVADAAAAETKRIADAAADEARRQADAAKRALENAGKKMDPRRWF